MIISMTGFGKAECEISNKKISIEVKSLNSKQLDINTRIPSTYKEKDIEIRRKIGDSLQRGKVDFSIYYENLGLEANAKINEPIVTSYFNQINTISQKLNLPVNESVMQVIMRLPDAVKVEHEELDENEWKLILSTICDALQHLVAFRKQEGVALEKDIISHIEKILELLTLVPPFEGERIEKIRERIQDNLNDLKLNGTVDHNRFEQELIFYLEKLDINEEKVRLKNHCDYFLQTMKEEASGRKLSFIAQEIGREVNTLGSKANHSEIQKIVVQMKDELEKIKEQVLNVL
ncbi:MAG: YicC/YloC family endoribonuclease [Bacteroidota bacterium]|nr:YicC/YloC family endoribonuclease [Bacteroidota bacterium]MDP4206333.1 YicC/YloC family endoribonuclease [Bacteroidota bacterium]